MAASGLLAFHLPRLARHFPFPHSFNPSVSFHNLLARPKLPPRRPVILGRNCILRRSFVAASSSSQGLVHSMQSFLSLSGRIGTRVIFNSLNRRKMGYFWIPCNYLLLYCRLIKWGLSSFWFEQTFVPYTEVVCHLMLCRLEKWCWGRRRKIWCYSCRRRTCGLWSCTCICSFRG